MRSRIFNLNWEDFNHKDSEQRNQLAGALQFYMATPDTFIPGRFEKVQAFVKQHKEFEGLKVQAFTIPSNFPTYEKAIDVVKKFQLMPEYDNGYEQIFDVLNFEGTKASGFDVMDMASGLTFNEVKVGEKLKVYQMAGEKERCYFSYYGGALGWHRGLFEDQQYWLAENNAIEFRGKAYGTRASVFYGLLEAAADAKGCCSAVPAGCTDCNEDALSIARSINYAATVILRNVSGKGYNTNPTTTNFVVLVPLEMLERVRQALAVRAQAFAQSPTVAAFNFIVVPSMMLTNYNRIMVILPKRKIIAGYRMDLTLFDDFDILSLTDTVAGWMRYGGCIGDLDQIECIEFEAISGSCPPSPEEGVGEPEAPA
jgi:hypothetical protein